MKTYKNVGVYKLCRMFPEDTTRFPIGEANKIIQENAPRTFITEDDTNFFEEVWDNHTVYYDFAVYGRICERENLTRLIEDRELKKAYRYYEWNQRFGWFEYFKKIINSAHQQLADFKCANDIYQLKGEVRILLFVN